MTEHNQKVTNEKFPQTHYLLSIVLQVLKDSNNSVSYIYHLLSSMTDSAPRLSYALFKNGSLPKQFGKYNLSILRPTFSCLSDARFLCATRGRKVVKMKLKGRYFLCAQLVCGSSYICVGALITRCARRPRGPEGPFVCYTCIGSSFFMRQQTEKAWMTSSSSWTKLAPPPTPLRPYFR